MREENISIESSEKEIEKSLNSLTNMELDCMFGKYPNRELSKKISSICDEIHCKLIILDEICGAIGKARTKRKMLKLDAYRMAMFML